MTGSISVESLTLEKRDVRRFWEVGRRVYAHDPHWVAPLWPDFRRLLSADNPFFDHAQMQLWVARAHDGRDVGRVAGIVDHEFIRQQDPGTIHFGFFEAEPEPEISRHLIRALLEWGRAHGYRRILGPMNPSSNEECGLLVEGFHEAPAVLTPYNPPYYGARLEAEGFRRAMNLLAFHIDLATTPWDRLERIQGVFQRRHRTIRVRPLLRRTFSEDLEKLRSIYNEAWESNWGFVPMTEREIRFLADRLRPLLVEGLVWVAETESEPVGFLLALPDLNEAVQPLRGRLWTPHVLLALPYLLGWRCPRRARVMVLGVRPKYRARGVETVMLVAALKAGMELGYRMAEASWVLENNVRSRRVIEAFGGKVSKTYRLYERTL